MLTAEENDLLCRVEGDAPMGALMRAHWLPICMSEEVSEPDGTPLPARLLGEDLVVFRDSDGRLGVVGEHCRIARARLRSAATRSRAALPLPRLEDRRRRQRRRNAVGAPGAAVSRRR
jgi:hypothetical protein